MISKRINCSQNVFIGHFADDRFFGDTMDLLFCSVLCHFRTIVILLVCFELNFFHRSDEEAAISEISDKYILAVINSFRYHIMRLLVIFSIINSMYNELHSELTPSSYQFTNAGLPRSARTARKGAVYTVRWPGLEYRYARPSIVVPNG